MRKEIIALGALFIGASLLDAPQDTQTVAKPSSASQDSTVALPQTNEKFKNPDNSVLRGEQKSTSTHSEDGITSEEAAQIVKDEYKGTPQEDKVSVSTPMYSDGKYYIDASLGQKVASYIVYDNGKCTKVKVY